MTHKDEKIVVIGAGFMGAGIAQVCIQNNFPCLLIDSDPDGLRRAVVHIEASLTRLSQKGVLTQAPKRVMAHLDIRNCLVLPPDPAWVIEAVYEDLALKTELLSQVEAQVGPETLLATNTSSIPIDRLADSLARPERFLGLHFFGPVPLMGLVEVVRGPRTCQAAYDKGISFIQALGKHPVGVQRDLPGFVMNRVFAAAFRECQDLVAGGVARAEDIDAGMRLGYGWRIGPFEIADNAGLDTVARINRSMKAQGEAHLFTKASLVEDLVAEGKLGRKSGEGFYRYDRQGGRKSDGTT